MYTIKQAALRSGVSISVLRAWERRYGIVRPDRTASGYRLYGEPDIERLVAMRQLVDSGWSPSQAAREIEAHGIPRAVAAWASPSPTEGELPQNASDTTDMATAFVEAAALLDERRVEAVLDDLFARGSFERVIDDRLMPALRALGDAWAAGSVSVAAEHAASHAVLRRLAAAFEAAGGSDVVRPVLVGLPPGSSHEIGALAFATALRRRGIGVVYLGADVPTVSWREAVRTTRARAIVLGISTAKDGAPARQVAEAANESPDLLVAAGGAGSRDADLPGSVVRLPDGIATSAAVLEKALLARLDPAK